MGACYAKYLEVLNKKNTKIKIAQPSALNNAYLGYEIKDREIILAIKKFKLKKRFIVKNKNINHIAAKLISNGKIISRVVGKAEFGARALGNRSILADPSNLDVKRIINEKIKNRDFWMPFAASTTQFHSRKYFKFDRNTDSNTYPYMTKCLDTNDVGKTKLAAAVHPYDNTCRPQIMLKNQNPEFEDLINKFGKISNVYALLNTSFNLHGKPIVNTANDAIKIFLKTDLDGLILGNYLIFKK